MKKSLVIGGMTALLPAAGFASETTDWIRPMSDISAGDTAWVMVSAILVLFMTLPGLALFYAGMVRKKNVLATMVQSIAVACLISLLWMCFGYSLAFTSNNGFIGGTERFFLSGMNVFTESEQLTIFPGAATIPEPVFMLFQMAFAVIAAAIITGAFAERIKFSGMLLFSALWSLLIYVPTAHWVWGPDGWLAADGVLDYAGGTVIHINAGIAGLVGAVIIGKRIGYGKEAMPPHNLVLTLVGMAMLWVGWFGFNAGSALAADGRAGMAMATTQIATAAAAVAWMLTERLLGHKPSALGLASGAVAGLVAITPAAGFVSVQSAVFIGLISGVICFWGATKLKYWLGYDDSLDAFGIHGIGGIVGAVLTGVFVSTDITGGGASLWVQIKSILITVGYSGVGSVILFFLVSKITGLRVEKDEERQGLDVVLHGERVE
ncbi:ammonium transporter [Testudinibacter sp. TR-2022]|uniref:ammonium transporter n=1 Tax=Testudinibacter sp. TR-2022 TaxID=2585029 RepID=UPI001119275B|nr:ammonium transporter [Testudinibacter sp. TR-2022]TNH09264.1 ammonium transporter [Pasteurellaceae bacterium Phil11]TNH25747.1 ammonium transporter [Testudinibacter sp. TR-2022]TNH28550.1 ammonium transporter [Testudinibacter sp. TR-2022]